MDYIDERDSSFDPVRSALILIFLMLSAWSVYFPVTNTDIWWHLSTGREILKKGAFLYNDIFSYTLNKPEWIDLHWLFQVTTHLVHSLFGIEGLMVLKMLSVVAIGIIIVRTCSIKWYGVVSALLWALAVFSFRYLMLLRPTIITLIMIALFFMCIERYRLTGKLFWIGLLIPLQIIWTNMQGLFILGQIIMAFFIVEKAYEFLFKGEDNSFKKFIGGHRGLLVLTGGIFLSSIVNPYGLKGLLFPFSLFMRINPFYDNIFSEYISENIPLFRMDLYTSTGYLIYTIAFTSLLLVSFIIKSGSIRIFHLVSSLAFCFLALIAKRNLTLFAVVFTIVTSYNLAHAQKRFKQLFSCLSFRISAGVFLLLIVVMQSLILLKGGEAYPHNSFISPFRVPVYSADYLENNRKEGRIFSTMRYGGYLLYKLFPEYRVNIDGRMIIRDKEFFKEYINLVTSPESEFGSYRERFDITRVLLPLSYVRMYDPIRRWLYHSNEWSVKLMDGESVLFEYTGDKAETMPLDVYENRFMGIIEKRFDGNRVILGEAKKNFYNFFNIVQKNRR